MNLAALVAGYVWPIVEPTVTLAITGVVVAVGAKVLNFLHLQNTASHQATVGAAVKTAVDALANDAITHVGSVSVPSSVEGAARYVLDHVPDAAKALGLTPEGVGATIAAKVAAALDPATKPDATVAITPGPA